MRIRPHESQVAVNFPDVGLVDSWSPDQLRPLFSHRPLVPPSHMVEVDQTYLERILDFLKVSERIIHFFCHCNKRKCNN
jgi:hypothetical protein